MPSSAALLRTASSVRPSLRPITRVGVLPRARPLRSLTSLGLQGLPELRFDFDILCLLDRVPVVLSREQSNRSSRLFCLENGLISDTNATLPARAGAY